MEITALDLYDLPPADVVILGEIHDNAEHHANQAIAVGAVGPSALVFEMLTPEMAARATPEARQGYGQLEAALGWDGSGWPDFTLYYPIFAAAPDAMVNGADVPAQDVHRAYTERAQPVFRGNADRFGLARPLDPADRSAREAEQQAAHCGAMPEDRLSGMVEVQRLRDAELARAAIEAHAETGGPVVVITGSGHARTDRGVPAVLAEAAPDLTVLAIGQIEGTPEGSPPYDLWIATDPIPREDPCEAFAE